MHAVRLYTPAEAAAVNEIGIKAVHNAIDKRIIDSGSGSGRSRRALTTEDLLRLKLWYGVGVVLGADRRKRLFDAVTSSPSANTVKADDLLIVDVGEARRQIAARVKELDEAEALVRVTEGVMGGEPVFGGTRIPVRTIAAMIAQGADEADILDGYPKLTPRMIELARIWVAAHPARGRPKTQLAPPFEARSSKRVFLKAESHNVLPDIDAGE